MKKHLILLGILFSVMPFGVKADEIAEDFKIVDSETKYYKVITYNFYNDGEIEPLSFENAYNTISEEITEAEYNSAQIINPLATTVETTYKKMTTSISTNGSKYRYQVVVDWKNIPKVKSYDIIGIGHFASVKISGSPKFSLTYDTSKSTSATLYQSSTGSSAIFNIPDDVVSVLNAKLYFDVEKNTDATIITQKAYGDYSHATQTVTLANAKSHTINTTGIVLNGSVYNYFDKIDTATATWTGSW